MSSIDNRIVQMQFNNKQFEAGAKTTLGTLARLKQALNFSGVKTGVDTLGAAINKALNVSGVASGIDSLNSKFSTIGIAWQRTIQQITDKAISAGMTISKALSTDALIDGLDEYTLKMDNIQTILTNTASKGTTLDDVNAALGELNKYADDTVYSFQDMTRAIGQFTTQGVDLETATAAIKGFSNLAAGTGTSNTDLARAEYQMSQALSTGVVKLMDWKSLETAGGMGGEYFQKGLIETAKSMGKTLPEGLEDGLISFRESLSDNSSSDPDWLTTDVLLTTLNKFAEDPTLKAAATEVKTFKQLIDTLKEALGTGWADSWEVIIGNFEEAKKLWTAVSDTLGGLIGNMSNARLEMLKEWKSLGGRDAAIQSIANAYEALTTVVEPAAQAIRKVFPKMTGKQLADLTKQFEKFTEKMSLTGAESSSVYRLFENLSNAVKNIINVIQVMASSFKMVFPASFRDTLFSIVDILGSLAGKVKFATSTIGKLQIVAKGIFSVFSISFQVLKSLFNVIKPLFGYIASGSGSVLNALVKVSQFLINLDESIKKTGVLDAVLGKVVNSFKKAIAWIKSIGYGIKGVFTDIVDSVSYLFGTIKNVVGEYLQGTVLNTIYETVVSIKDKIVGIVGDILTDVSEIWGDGEAIDTSAISITKSTKSLSLLSKVLSGIKDVFTKIGETIGSIAEHLSPVIDALKTAVMSVFGLVKSFVTTFASGIDGSTMELLFDNVLKMMSGGAIFAFIKTFKKSGDTVNKTMTTLSTTVNNLLLNFQGIGANLNAAAGSIKTMFDSLTGSIKSLQTNIKSKTLREIAVSIAILAGSMLVLSLINVDRVLPTIGAMASLFAELTGSMIALTKLTGDVGVKQMTAVSVAMVAMSIAVAILAGSLYKMSKVDSKTLSNSALVMTGLIGALVAVSRTLSRDTKGMVKGAIALVIFSSAIKNLAKTVQILSTLPTDKLISGLIGTLVLMTGITVAMRVGKFDSIGIKSAIGIYIFARAINVLSDAVLSLGSADLVTLAKGLGAVAVAMGATVGALILVNKFAGDSKFLSMGIGMVLFATGIKILASSIAAFGSMSWESIGKGLLTFAGAMAVVVGSVILITKFAGNAKFIAASVGLVIFSAGMAILGKVLQSLGSMSWESIGKGLLTFAGAMAVVVASVILLNKFAGSADFLATAAGLVVFSVGLKAIASVIDSFSGMSLKEIGTGLLAFAGAMAVTVGSLVLLSKLVPAPQLLITAAALVIVSIAIKALADSMAVLSGLGIQGVLVALLALAGAFVVIGAAAVIIGPLSIVILALGVAIAALGLGMSLAAASIFIFVSALTAFIALGSGAGAAITAMITAIAAGIPALLAAVGEGIVALVQSIAMASGSLASAALLTLISVLTAIRDNIYQITQLAADIIVGFMDGLSSKLPDLVDSAVNLIITFIDSLGTAIDEHGDEFIDAIWKLFTSLIKLNVKIIEKGKELMGKLWDGIQNLPLVQNVKDFVGDAIDGISEKINDIFDIGKNLIEGLWNGIKDAKDWVIDKVKGVGQDILDGLSGIFDEHSPSKKTAEMGEYLMEGLGIGIDNKANYALSSAETCAKDTMSMFNDVLSKPFETDFTSMNALKPTLDLSNVQYGRSAIANMLNGHAVSVDGMKTSLTADFAKTLPDVDFSNDEVVSAIRELRSDVQALSESMESMQIVMDTGTMVGELAKPMNKEMSRLNAYARRHN